MNNFERKLFNFVGQNIFVRKSKHGIPCLTIKCLICPFIFNRCYCSWTEWITNEGSFDLEFFVKNRDSIHSNAVTSYSDIVIYIWVDKDIMQVGSAFTIVLYSRRETGALYLSSKASHEYKRPSLSNSCFRSRMLLLNQCS